MNHASQIVRAGLFFGSTDGNTQQVAARIQTICAADPAPWATVDLHDVAAAPLALMANYQLLLLGVPTWNVGQLQRDWERVLEQLDGLALRGICAAPFGLGDQSAYPDTFADALVFVAEKVAEQGATLIGRWPATGYSFRQSWALGDDGCFAGLVLDEINQPQQTEPRLRAWLAQIRREWHWQRAKAETNGNPGQQG